MLRGLALLTVLMLVGAACGQPSPPAPRRVLEVGGLLELHMSNRQRIQRYFVSRPGVVRVHPVPDDPTTLLVVGVRVGMTEITLIGQDGAREVCRLGR